MEWHKISDPNDPELDRLAKRYDLHPLHIEDCRHRNQNAKIEENNGYVFTVMKGVRLDSGGVLLTADLDIFLGENYLITVLEDDCPEMQALIEQVGKVSTGDTRADQVYYRILDQMVDTYLPVLDHFDEVIDGLEDQALERPTPETLAGVFATKRSLIVLRRVLVNTRDVASHLQRTESLFIRRDMWPFLRDVYDHVARNLDTVEMLRDLLTGALDVYLSSVANRTNQVMKVLTVLGTVALPAVVVSSIYGMNVKGLPGAESPHALGIVLLLMAGFTGVLLWALKKYEWL
ncbi:MAG: magnesium transporter CorA family protein [Candidatus Solibacter sp.]